MLIKSNIFKVNQHCGWPLQIYGGGGGDGGNTLQHLHVFNRNENCFVSIASSKSIKGDSRQCFSFMLLSNVEEERIKMASTSATICDRCSATAACHICFLNTLLTVEKKVNVTTLYYIIA